MNSCYASVECSLNPSLKGKPVAVGGNEESRHGIILAKSEEAKICGVKTGEPLWQARQKCPELIIVEPHFDAYKKYSKMAREIYRRYTDKIEPMGLDEAWCDLTGSTLAFGSGEYICGEIKESFKRELDITVSIGLSYNKIFAKLGSDLANRDSIVTISSENFKRVVWPLPVTAIMGVGKSTGETLRRYGVSTVGDLARCDVKWLELIFGVMGQVLWKYANGLDDSVVMPDGYREQIKSIGHGVTCKSDLVNNEEVWKVFLSLSQSISKQLKEQKLEATGVQISVRDKDFATRQFQKSTETATQSPVKIAKTASELFEKNYCWNKAVRALTVRAINLQKEGTPFQLSFDFDCEKYEKQKKIDNAVFSIRERFGSNAIFNCCLMTEKKIPHHSIEKRLPVRMFR